MIAAEKSKTDSNIVIENIKLGLLNVTVPQPAIVVQTLYLTITLLTYTLRWLLQRNQKPTRTLLLKMSD